MTICDRCLMASALIEKYNFLVLELRESGDQAQFSEKRDLCIPCRKVIVESIRQKLRERIDPTPAAPNESQTAKRDASVTEAGLQNDGGTEVTEADCQSMDAGR